MDIILYKKCRKCPNACRCCTSHFKEIWARCSSCTNSRSEFEPATHIHHCPLDGKLVERPLYDINGNLVKGWVK